MGRSGKVSALTAELQDRLRFETLLSDLIARFVRLPPGQVDAAIEDAQRRFCEELGLDRSSLWQPVADDPDAVLVTHFFQAAGGFSSVHPQTVGPPPDAGSALHGPPGLPSYKRLDVRAFCPWIYGELRRGETVVISRLDELPDEAAPDREFLKYYGTKSSVLVPLSGGGAWLGFLTFASLAKARTWPEPLVKRFQLIAQVFAGALAEARAETRVDQLRAELGHATRVTLLGELTASLVHEVNRPLAAILSNAQAARRWLSEGAPDPAELRDVLDDIIADDKRAAEILRGIRQMLHREANPREPVELNKVIGDVAALLDGELEAVEVQLRLDLAPDLPAIRASAIEIQQVLLNFMLNGIQAMRDSEAMDRLLTVAARLEEGGVTVVVSDTGGGLTDEARRRLWEPFFTTKPRGLGMGLPICRRIVEAHGGRIWAGNNADRGATFGFSLPVGDPE